MTHSKNKHYSDHAWERAAPAALCRAHYFVVAYLGRDQPPLAIWMRLPLPNAQSEDEGELCTGNHRPMKRRQAHNAGPLPLSPVPPHVNRLTLTCLPRENIATISHKRLGGDRLPLRVYKAPRQHTPNGARIYTSPVIMVPKASHNNTAPRSEL